MKFVKLIILLSIALSAISSKHTLAVFGDPGQIDNYFKLIIQDRNAATLPSGSTLAISDDCKIETKPLTMDNWSRVLTAVKDTLANSDQAVILGDMVYPESKGANYRSIINPFWKSFAQANARTPIQYWKKRLSCGWETFVRITLSLVPVKFKGANKFSNKFQLIPGNHLYDVSPTDELASMTNASTQADGVVWYHPTSTTNPTWLNAARIQTIVDGNNIIKYLDFNSAVFELVAGITDFSDATVLTAIQTSLENQFWSIEGITKEDCLSTLKGIFLALTAIAAETTGKTTYRILRAHHPPFNLEGDMVGMFTFKQNGKSFMEACREAKVHLYLASHHHSSQIWATRYEDAVKVTRKRPYTAPNPDPNPNFECWNINKTPKKDCAKYELPTGINLASPTYFYVVVIGNSGRFFGPLTSVDRSWGTLLFGRAVGKNYGGAILEIQDSGLNVSIYENVEGQATTTEVAKLTLNIASGGNQAIPNHLPITPTAARKMKKLRNKK